MKFVNKNKNQLDNISPANNLEISQSTEMTTRIPSVCPNLHLICMWRMGQCTNAADQSMAESAMVFTGSRSGPLWNSIRNKLAHVNQSHKSDLLDWHRSIHPQCAIATNGTRHIKINAFRLSRSCYMSLLVCVCVLPSSACFVVSGSTCRCQWCRTEMSQHLRPILFRRNMKFFKKKEISKSFIFALESLDTRHFRVWGLDNFARIGLQSLLPGCLITLALQSYAITDNWTLPSWKTFNFAVDEVRTTVLLQRPSRR